eukprot:CAMPEP_0174361944 /NCGR_PEP_ID=MMETSP0811_2-20130205/61765_1 /TAXON_ID=73025 ORGANISM="Eutreptiella gymnastica-like, Strain CCMP1594" /NCGR_SAMPLE_ID=MMETSP0811_2 /ASSEMBLY_ACC=CAM_ASM_000667 /LENGTH=91 /DNA_ID=CAMNT_0015499071 /DNA_START=260 /DNA_END=535 /DNA_ORIENTATION=+
MGQKRLGKARLTGKEVVLKSWKETWGYDETACSMQTRKDVVKVRNEGEGKGNHIMPWRRRTGTSNWGIGHAASGGTRSAKGWEKLCCVVEG